MHLEHSKTSCIAPEAVDPGLLLCTNTSVTTSDGRHLVFFVHDVPENQCDQAVVSPGGAGTCLTASVLACFWVCAKAVIHDDTKKGARLVCNAAQSKRYCMLQKSHVKGLCLFLQAIKTCREHQVWSEQLDSADILLEHITEHAGSASVTAHVYTVFVQTLADDSDYTEEGAKQQQ